MGRKRKKKKKIALNKEAKRGKRKKGDLGTEIAAPRKQRGKRKGGGGRGRGGGGGGRRKKGGRGGGGRRKKVGHYKNVDRIETETGTPVAVCGKGEQRVIVIHKKRATQKANYRTKPLMSAENNASGKRTWKLEHRNQRKRKTPRLTYKNRAGPEIEVLAVVDDDLPESPAATKKFERVYRQIPEMSSVKNSKAVVGLTSPPSQWQKAESKSKKKPSKEEGKKKQS